MTTIAESLDINKIEVFVNAVDFGSMMSECAELYRVIARAVDGIGDWSNAREMLERRVRSGATITDSDFERTIRSEAAVSVWYSVLEQYAALADEGRDNGAILKDILDRALKNGTSTLTLASSSPVTNMTELARSNAWRDIFRLASGQNY